MKTRNLFMSAVVTDTAKQKLFKQFTTLVASGITETWLLQILRSRNFLSNSQRKNQILLYLSVVTDTAKQKLFKQFTTLQVITVGHILLLQILRSRNFLSNSQQQDSFLS